MNGHEAYIHNLKNIYPHWDGLISTMVRVGMSDTQIQQTVFDADRAATDIISNKIENYKK